MSLSVKCICQYMYLSELPAYSPVAPFVLSLRCLKMFTFLRCFIKSCSMDVIRSHFQKYPSHNACGMLIQMHHNTVNELTYDDSYRQQCSIHIVAFRVCMCMVVKCKAQYFSLQTWTRS